MQTPLFVDGQFVDGTLLNGAIAMMTSNFELVGSELHTPGLLSPASMTITAGSPSPLYVTLNLPSPFAVLFGDGALVNANGLVSGATTTTYAVNLASLVPAFGTATVYILASYGQIGEQQTQVIGPPEGHPDYDPTFAPFNWYLEGLGTLTITAGTTAADNETTFELCRLSLAAGQATINQSSIVTSNWQYASAVLDPTGVTAGTYAGATVTVGADGRLTGVSSVAYGPLAGNNTWTGTNIFDDPITAHDTGTGGVVVVGGGNGANIELQGGGTTTPNKYLRALNGVFEIINSAYTAAPLTLTDAGVLTILGELFSQGINAGAGEISTTGELSGGSLGVGGAASIGTTLYVGSTLTAEGEITTPDLVATIGTVGSVAFPGGGEISTPGPVYSSSTVQGLTVDASGGNVTANGGYLRATYGARNNPGDPNAGVIQNDFYPFEAAPTYDFLVLPNNIYLQWGEGGFTGANGAQVVKNFPTAFPNACLGMALTIGWSNGTSYMGAQPLNNSQYGMSCYSPAGSYFTSEGYVWMAVGF